MREEDAKGYIDVTIFHSSHSRADRSSSTGDIITMKKREVHYKVKNGHIVMWDGNNGYMPVAKVINDLHCKIIVRTLQFAEECEECIDYEGDFKMFQECFSSYIRDSMMEWKNNE